MFLVQRYLFSFAFSDKLKVLASDSEADSFLMEPTQSEKSPDNVKKIGVKTLSTPIKCEENSRTEKSSCAAGLNRIRHQVMKTFADEDGFMGKVNFSETIVNSGQLCG